MPAFTKSTAELERDLKAAKRALAVKEAYSSLLRFTQLTMPDINDLDDSDLTSYDAQPHHLLLCEALERVERGECMRLAITIAPQHGKTEIAVRRFIAWYMGRNPTHPLIFGTYNDTRAEEEGGEVREIMTSKVYQSIFPKVGFRLGSKSKAMLTTVAGGRMAFIGRGGSGTGKPARLVIIDDPLKNEEEAESPTIRKILHGWFSKVIYSRAQVRTAIICIHTRWNEDDLIGRLCDPDHPDYDKDAAAEWTYVNIPAVLKPGPVAEALGIVCKPSTDPLVIKQFGDGPVAALWPDKFPLKHLASAARLNPQGFNSLYMGKPTPDDGEYFKKDWLLEYDRGQLPENLRKYGASDHAVTEERKNDSNVMGCVGVDPNDHIWVLPDLVWDRMETDRIVEELLSQFKIHHPLLWWMEDDVIRKSFGPFLKKRMQETRTYCTIQRVSPSKDKRARARSIQGRLQQQVVHFPRFAPWWRDAKAQLLKFPFGAHDDFVDWLAHIGMGLVKEVAADAPRKPDNIIRVGSIQWVKGASEAQTRRERMKKAIAGW